MIETVFTLALVTQVLLPGWIFCRIRRKFFVVEAEAHIEESFLAYGVSSLLMLAITWPVFTALGFDPLGALIAAQDANAFLAALSAAPIRWLLQLIVTPAVLSILWVYIERQAWSTGIFTRLGMPPQPRRPNAIQAAIWHHRDKTPLLEITDKKGDVLVGRFGPNSAATISKGWPDLYLEQVYRPTPDGAWELDDSCTGIFVPGSDIRRIRFFRDDTSTEPDAEPVLSSLQLPTNDPTNA